MNTYLFQPGNNPGLSLAELTAVSQRLGEPLQSIRLHGNVILANANDLDLTWVNDLGGIIRVCKVQPDCAASIEDDPTIMADAVVESICDSLFYPKMTQKNVEANHRVCPDDSECDPKEHPQGEVPTGEETTNGKIIFGISILEKPSKDEQFFPVFLKLLSARLKEQIKALGRSVRFVPTKHKNDIQLSSVQVEKNHLLNKGCELVFYVDHNELKAAQTVWVQPFEAFSYRDFGRPGRDDRSGMLPPKLARMLINLARQQDTRTIIDPFCGSGSILMEAGIMGLRATGIDNSEKAIHDTQRNTAWLQDHVQDFTGSVQSFVGDARHLHTLVEPVFFDACAAEPYLGPPHSKPIPEAQFAKWSKDLLALYRRALGEIRTICKPGARVVFILPRFKIQNKSEPASLQILADLKYLGYTILDPHNGFAPTAKRASVIYAREKQAVQREIFILQA